MIKTWTDDFITRFLALVILLVASALAPAAQANLRSKEAPVSKIQKVYNIEIELDGAVILATLDDNATTRDFIARLPLRLELKDYASTEKVGFLPDKLTTQGAPSGSTPVVGDISYYAPWGNLAIYYKDFGYSPGLIKLGEITAGLQHLRYQGVKQAQIKRVPGR